MDKFRVDNHKLHYHVGRVNSWLNGENIYPVYMEISPTGACNHRCTFCGVDYLGYKPRSLETSIVRERLAELGALGLKSVMFCGEGEPLLHKDIAEMVESAKAAGIDVSMTTNGVLFKKGLAERILPHMEWIKFSVNAATNGTYMKVNGAKSGELETVINNITAARKIKDDNTYKVTLGMQMILLPENREEAVALARIARDTGADYLVVKPYSQHPQSGSTVYKDVKYEDTERLAEELAALNGNGFSVIFRGNAMSKNSANAGKAGRYQKCQALPFWSYLDSGGGVWGCLDFVGDGRFYYGSIYENSFRQIWEGEKRRKSLEWVANGFDLCQCRNNCRMDEVNRYLWDLKNPPPHVNFI
ncbi:MAG: radical SAM protein [Nitrospinae bacterium]|nr:radical SAM protein [Nitrospinota bacterium]